MGTAADKHSARILVWVACAQLALPVQGNAVDLIWECPLVAWFPWVGGAAAALVGLLNLIQVAVQLVAGLLILGIVLGSGRPSRAVAVVCGVLDTIAAVLVVGIPFSGSIPMIADKPELLLGLALPCWEHLVLIPLWIWIAVRPGEGSTRAPAPWIQGAAVSAIGAALIQVGGGFGFLVPHAIALHQGDPAGPQWRTFAFAFAIRAGLGLTLAAVAFIALGTSRRRAGPWVLLALVFLCVAIGGFDAMTIGFAAMLALLPTGLLAGVALVLALAAGRSG